MLTKVEKYIGMSDFRRNLSRYLRDAKKKPIVVSTNRGQQTRVIIDANLYNELVEAHENQTDAQCLRERAASDKGGRIPWREVKKMHGLQGRVNAGGI